MKFTFYKYQGTGNDFIILDNRGHVLSRQQPELYRKWCDRRFGIGADGLILLQSHAHFDFEMVYFNADGNESSMCGNGGRCIVRFAHDQGIIGKKTTFTAIDGVHEALVNDDDTISLKMNDVKEMEAGPGYFYLNTGSPHYVAFTKDPLEKLPLVELARNIRYGERFAAVGTNVNYAQEHPGYLDVRTYERGVEGETYSCGTGVTAVAIAYHHNAATGAYQQAIHTPGGQLEVSFKKLTETHYGDVWLKGPATFVFTGETGW